jgi:predicted PurR-regulated permease PerM
VLARPFLAIITWALALAVVAHPWHAWLERRLRPGAAAALAVLIVALVLIAPAALVVQRVFVELGDTARVIGTDLNSLGFRGLIERYPPFASVLHWVESRIDLSAELKRLAGTLASRASTVVGGSVWILTQLVLTLLALFYFLRDQHLLLQFIRRLLPFTDEETTELFRRVSQTIYASLYGNLAVKLVQGLLGGLMFWILGLPAPVLCGLTMSLLATLPMMGASLVWGPAAIYLAMNGSWIKAIVLCGWGLLVVSLIDNVLYPLLVAGELRLHTLAVFFAMLGGLIAFGVSGVVLGPVILAVTYGLLELWRIRGGGDLETSAPPAAVAVAREDH